jgi:nitrate/nitrite-specific signal transduction histidine kinase
MATELIILPTAYRHDITEDQIRYALANVIDVFESQGNIPLTIITGPADNDGELVIEVGFEVAESGNLVIYHAMAARPKYR